MRRRDLLSLALAGGFAPGLLAAPSARSLLERFSRQAARATGRFTQLMLDKSGAAREPESSGMFAFSRPGKFSWIVESPYRQSVISNGTRLWLYDPDLMQVTVKNLAGTFSAAPVAVLFGNADLDKTLVLQDEPKRDGLVWVKATPRQTDPSFAFISVGFTESGELAKLELTDHFAQKTVLTFSEIKLNGPIADDVFEFVIPKGVDVLEDRQN